MFLKELTVESKIAFLALARLVIAADGILEPEELAMVDDVASEMGVDPESGPRTGNLEELCRTVRMPEERAQMLLELASVAHVDDHYSSEERQLLRQIGALWDVDTITLIRIETWAETRIQMSREAAEIVREIKTWRL